MDPILFPLVGYFFSTAALLIVSYLYFVYESPEAVPFIELLEVLIPVLSLGLLLVFVFGPNDNRPIERDWIDQVSQAMYAFTN